MGTHFSLFQSSDTYGPIVCCVEISPQNSSIVLKILGSNIAKRHKIAIYLLLHEYQTSQLCKEGRGGSQGFAG